MNLNGVTVVVSALLLAVAFVKRNEFPSGLDRLPALDSEPRQTASTKRPFRVTFNDVEYRVKPKYRYALDGLVVSFRHHDGKSHMHSRSQDHLNMLDVCVVWGGNADPELLNRLSFWNGIFTCNVETRDREAWGRFDMFDLANNHLISDSPRIRNEVRSIRIGDQIRVEGWLASYGTRTGDERGTSTTRSDTGNGACETIYVERFEITRAGFGPWRITMWAALGTLLLALVNHFRTPHRPYRRAA